MTLSNAIPRFLHMLGEAMLQPPLSTKVSEYQTERAQLLSNLRDFENEVLRLRRLLKSGQISFYAIDQNFREWCAYSDSHYYLNMEFRYRRLRFDDDADRVAQMSKHGQKKTTVTTDENGNIVSETVATGSTVGNAVELEF